MAIEAETKVTGFLLKWDSIKTVDMEVEVEKLQKELLGSCYDLFTCVASYCCLAAFPYIEAGLAWIHELLADVTVVRLRW